MSIEACAGLVRSQDPERFAATMTAPSDQRAPLFVVFAFNLELARAGVVASEPMIGEMRLQFWRDCLNAAKDSAPRAHDVAGPLMELASAPDFPMELAFDMIEARSLALDPAFPDSEAALDRFLAGTGGALLALAGTLAGVAPAQRAEFQAYGTAAALGNLFRAVPQLAQSRARVLVDGRASALQDRARAALSQMDRAGAVLSDAKAPAVLRSVYLARPALELALKAPERVAAGRLELSEFRKKIRLLRLVLTKSF